MSDETLLARLRTRKLVQWMLAYLAAAWLLAQAFALVGDQFDWARQTQRAITLALGFGVLPALVVAWFHGERGAQRVSAPELIALALSLALAGTGVGSVMRLVPVEGTAQAPQPAPAATLDKRHVAVLPFANLGDGANAGFTDGVHDTLITQISRVPGLTVISRTSVMHWRDQHPTVAEIASALGVGTVLEGSVQRAGDALRIQVQLIDAASDTHLWAEIYDRAARDVFAVQSEIAQKVADAVQIHLAPAESAALSERPTRDDEAYEHFLLGSAHAANDEQDAAITEFQAALARDPQFALAEAELAIAAARLAQTTNDYARKPGLWDVASAAMQRAGELAPQMPEHRLANALLLYWHTQDLAAAEREFRRVVDSMPNDVRAHETYAWLLRRQGRWEEAAAMLERATLLDPRNDNAGEALRWALIALNDRAGVERALRRSEAARPGDEGLLLARADLALALNADVRPTLRVAEAYFAAHTQKFWAAASAWAAATALGDDESARRILARVDWSDPEVLPYLRIARAATELRSGQREQGLQTLAAVRALAERLVEDDPRVISRLLSLGALAQIEALSGNGAEALARVAEAEAVLPIGADFADGLVIWSDLLFVPAMVGERSETLRLLQRFLAYRNPMTPPMLWCSPWANDLRTDPAFRAVMAKAGVDVSKDPGGRPIGPST
jgi:TolB-like protein/Tfp pilus assembly protein PilF